MPTDHPSEAEKKHEPQARTRASAVLAELAEIPVLLPNPPEVLGYLSQHPDIVGLVAALSRAARAGLPPNVQLSLELYRDREGDDSYLTLYARQKHYAPDLLDRIDVANEAVGDMLRDCSGWIQLTTDFQSPR